MNTDNITYMGKTDGRSEKIKFGIKDSDRTRHIYVVGKTGMGKSTLIENMAAQDAINGNGFCFIDPHGSAIETILDVIPEDRINDVVYFAPFDLENPISFNVFESVDPSKRHLVAQGLLSAFKKIWGEEKFSDRMEHITGNCLLALLEYPGSTILGMTRILTEDGYREDVVSHITDPSVRNFWLNEYGKWDDRFRKDAGAAILNKVGQFTTNPIIRNIVGQPESSIDFRKIMDEKKILLVNLSVGQIGEQNANLLGSMITTKIYLAALSRADLEKEELAEKPNFYLYIDEFQNLANDSFAQILSEARKYKLNLTIAHQYIEQMPESIRNAVFGNIGTMVTFRVGAQDAELFEKEFSPIFTADDIVNLGAYHVYLRLMINGVGSQPFSASTLMPITAEKSFRKEIIESSRKKYTKPKGETEKNISEWLTRKIYSEKEKRDKEKKQEKRKEKLGLNSEKFKKTDTDNSLPGKTSLKDALKKAMSKDSEEKKEQEKPKEVSLKENIPQKNVLENEENLSRIKEVVKEEPKISIKIDTKGKFGLTDKEAENLKDFLKDVE